MNFVNLSKNTYFLLQILFVSTLSLYVANVNADFTSTVQAVHSGKCIDLPNGSTTKGVGVQQLDCNGSGQQSFTFTPVAGKQNVYTIRFDHSGQCLDMEDGSTAKGAEMIQWPCHEGINQQFKLTSFGNSVYSLGAVHSDNVVDVWRKSVANGATILQWNFLNGDNQKWVINKIEDGDNSSASLGQWSNVIAWPHIAVSAANLPDGRILTWASNEKTAFPIADQFSHSAIFNPANNGFQTTNNPRHDMFCAGISLLEDGTILASGGNPQLRNTSVFKTTSLSWVMGPLMNQQRWYGTNLTLPNGEVFSTFAKGANNSPEVYTPGAGWTDVPKASMVDLLNEQNTVNAPPGAGSADIVEVSEHELAEAALAASLNEQNTDNVASGDLLSARAVVPNNSTTAQWYAYMHVAPDGRVFHSGPTQTMHWFDTEGSGDVVNAGKRLNGDRHRQFGSSIMYDVGKLLVTGGNDLRLNPPSTATAMTIDIIGSAPAVKSTQSMKFARVNHNSVVLPTGEVLVIGGNSSGILFSDQGSALTPEIWSPQTKKWRNMANMSIPRNYHSLALLLQDGRVLSAGGGLCGDGCAANHQDGQIFSPPYLFKGDGTAAARPSISSGPAKTTAGGIFTVSANANIARFSMIRLSSTTHSINTDQRYLSADFTPKGNNKYELFMDDNQNVLIPGNYWLFAINSQGVPSTGRLIKVQQR